MIVLLNDAWICAIPSATFFFTFFRTRVAAVGVCCCGGLAMVWFLCCSTRQATHRSSLGRCRLRGDRLLARTFTRARVGARALTAHRQALAMTQAPIGAEVHQPLDVHRHLAAPIAL